MLTAKLRPDGMAGRFEAFPYPVHEVRGRLDLTLTGDRPPRLDVDLTAEANGRRPVTIQGRVEGDGPAPAYAMTVAGDAIAPRRDALAGTAGEVPDRGALVSSAGSLRHHRPSDSRHAGQAVVDTATPSASAATRRSAMTYSRCRSTASPAAWTSRSVRARPLTEPRQLGVHVQRHPRPLTPGPGCHRRPGPADRRRDAGRPDDRRPQRAARRDAGGGVRQPADEASGRSGRCSAPRGRFDFRADVAHTDHHLAPAEYDIRVEHAGATIQPTFFPLELGRPDRLVPADTAGRSRSAGTRLGTVRRASISAAARCGSAKVGIMPTCGRCTPTPLPMDADLDRRAADGVASGLPRPRTDRHLDGGPRPAGHRPPAGVAGAAETAGDLLGRAGAIRRRGPADRRRLDGRNGR